MDRATMAEVIQTNVAAARGGADQAAARLQLATQSGLLPPDHYRRHVRAGIDALIGLSGDMEDLLDLLNYYQQLFPEAHDDVSGACACGRAADTCPARAAAADGNLWWTAEDGLKYPISAAGPQELPTEPAPEAHSGADMDQLLDAVAADADESA